MEGTCSNPDEFQIQKSTENSPDGSQCLDLSQSASDEPNPRHSSNVPSSILRASLTTYTSSGTNYDIPSASIQNSKFASNIDLFPNSTSSNPSNTDLITGRLNDFVKKFRSKLDSYPNVTEINIVNGVNENVEEEFCACLPPIETFMGISRISRKKHFFQYLQQGDLLCVKITGHSDAGFICKVLCMDGGKRRDIHDCDIKVYCPFTQCEPLSNNLEKKFEGYQSNDILRVVVMDVIESEKKIVASMKEELISKKITPKLKIGLIAKKDLPVHYLKQRSINNQSYDQILNQTLSFKNPFAVVYLTKYFNLPVSNRPSFLDGLHNTVYDESEYAKGLRKKQSNEWAFQSVKDAAEYLKMGKPLESHQAVNKALMIDPENVDGLIVRGCMFAGTKNFAKSLDDFEKAYSINPHHVSIKKYLSATLLEYGRIQQHNGEFDSAQKSFQRVCEIDENNTRAWEALKALHEARPKPGLKTVVPHDFSKLTKEEKRIYSQMKKEKRKKRKKISSSSASSSPSSPSSSSSASASSPSSSTSESSHSPKSNKRSRHKHKRYHSRKYKSKNRKKSKKSNKRSKNKPRHSASSATMFKWTVYQAQNPENIIVPINSPLSLIEIPQEVPEKVSSALENPETNIRALSPALSSSKVSSSKPSTSKASITGRSRSRSRSRTRRRHRSSSHSHSCSRSKRKQYSHRLPHRRHHKDNIPRHSRALDPQDSQYKAKETAKELTKSETIIIREGESANQVQQESSAVDVELAFQNFENFIRKLKDKQRVN